MAARALIGVGVSVALMSSLTAFVLWYPAERLSSMNAIAFSVGLVGAMAVVTRARDLLLPLLFLPLAIPIVIGGVGASVADGSGRYLGFLALYDAIFALLAWASFEYVVTE